MSHIKPKIQFNRQELSGAFGDIGTDFPLLVAMILAAGLHTPSVLIVFGLLQVLTGVIYRLPMPVQPLKAMATLVIAQKIGGPILLGAGLSIGVIMLILSMTGVLHKLTTWIPKTVIRGLQMGLGLSLCALAFKEYLPSQNAEGYVLAALAFVLIMVFIDKKKYPVTLFVIALGILYTLFFDSELDLHSSSIGLNLPRLHFPAMEDVAKGFVLLALPQIPLSLGNSILATKQICSDLYPERTDINVTKLGLTYATMNLVSPLVSGVPVCHGAGGMVGHYTFGGRTGGSVIIYGLFYILLGLLFGNAFDQIIHFFPLPILGVILAIEGLSLILLIRDLVSDKRNFVLSCMIGLLAYGLSYGFVWAICIGTALYYSPLKLETFTHLGTKK